MIIVTGFPRSGTSMLCQCLEAGGLSVHKNPNRNRRLHLADDGPYKIQGGDVYEPSATERRALRFPWLLPVRVVKVVIPFLGDVAASPAGYSVIMLRRDAEEIRQSNEAAFGEYYSTHYIKDATEEAYATLQNRKDVDEIVTFWYRDLFEDGYRMLGSLGLDMDVSAAAAVIDPRQYRFRREWLHEGATMPRNGV